MQAVTQANELVGQSHGKSLGHADARYRQERVATICPEPPASSSHLCRSACGHYARLVRSSNRRLAIRNSTQLIENKQSGSFLIDSIFRILRPTISHFDGSAPRPTDYYAPTTNRYLRCPCASITRGGKIKCCGMRRTDRVRHHQ
jgi:hypothetical protein